MERLPKVTRKSASRPSARIGVSTTMYAAPASCTATSPSEIAASSQHRPHGGAAGSGSGRAGMAPPVAAVAVSAPAAMAAGGRGCGLATRSWWKAGRPAVPFLGARVQAYVVVVRCSAPLAPYVARAISPPVFYFEAPVAYLGTWRRL